MLKNELGLNYELKEIKIKSIGYDNMMKQEHKGKSTFLNKTEKYVRKMGYL